MALRASLWMCVFALLVGAPASGQDTAVVTITDPVGVPLSHDPDTDGILIWESQNFAEAGMHVEQGTLAGEKIVVALARL